MLLFSAVTAAEGLGSASVVILDLKTGERETLLERAGLARYVQSGPALGVGHLVWGLDGALFAAPFDLKTRAVGGTSSMLGDIAGTAIVTFASVSDTGTLAYFSTGGSLRTTIQAGGGTVLSRVDRDGTVQREPLRSGAYGGIELSPEGDRAIINSLNLDALLAELWIYEFGSGRYTPLTFDHSNGLPVWTRAGDRVVYVSGSTISLTQPSLLSLPTDRSDQQPTVLADLSATVVLPTSIHPTDPVLMGIQFRRSLRGDIVLLDLPEDLTAANDATDADFRVLFETNFDERFASFSPDGRWIAYSSDESGISQVYVVPYGGGRKSQVSVDGGRMPRWNPAGGELFFLDDAGLMVAVVEAVATGEAFRSGIPERLFENGALAGFDASSDGFLYDVFPDGQAFEFLSPANAGNGGDLQLRVVENWFEELNELSPIAD